jgi:hypothetical protein
MLLSAKALEMRSSIDSIELAMSGLVALIFFGAIFGG